MMEKLVMGQLIKIERIEEFLGVRIGIVIKKFFMKISILENDS